MVEFGLSFANSDNHMTYLFAVVVPFTEERKHFGSLLGVDFFFRARGWVALLCSVSLGCTGSESGDVHGSREGSFESARVPEGLMQVCLTISLGHFWVIAFVSIFAVLA